MVKNLLAMWETWVWSLGWEAPLEEVMATHSSIPAWRIPMDRGAGQATVHGVSESDTTERLSTAKRSVSLGSVSSDVSSHRWKILEKIQKVTKKPNLNLPHAGNYLHSSYIVLRTIITWHIEVLYILSLFLFRLCIYFWKETSFSSQTSFWKCVL